MSPLGASSYVIVGSALVAYAAAAAAAAAALRDGAERARRHLLLTYHLR